MQLAKSTFIALAALALLAVPVFAKNTKTQKAESENASSSCSSYQLGPDGNWTPLPCQELGPRSSQQNRTPPKDHGKEVHS